MTPVRFALASALFHLIAMAATLALAWRWRTAQRCSGPLQRWLPQLAGEVFGLAVFVYAVSLLSTQAANVGYDGRFRVGPMSLRLLGQGLFIEGPLLAALLSVSHHRARRTLRAVSFAAASVLLVVVHVDAYYIEPRMLVPRHYVVQPISGGDSGESIRILHITDIQTPVIGLHEEEALRTGLTFGPDIIVLTGDYVQDALGRETELTAASDLRALMKRIGFTAPLGVFATEGDVGPPCAVVFQGTDVQCLTDRSVSVPMPGGRALGVTGLRRSMGRERDPKVLQRLLDEAPPADYRIVISHAPDFVSAMPVDVDLALAGHTHGGQVVLPFYGPPRTAIRLPRRYAGGLNMYGGTPLHVSRGVGMERGFVIPVRFLCPPEIGILDLRLPKHVSRIATR